MPSLGLDTEIIDQEVYDHSTDRFREAGIRLPTFGQLAAPETIAPAVVERLADVDPAAAHALNLFRVHWFNAPDGGFQELPAHLVLPEALTGVKAKIVVLLGDRFPMIRAHKVLASYACLAPRIVTGQFDPTHHRAIWPSTGNYCRGGVAVSRIMGCRGVAVLPEGMSEERFRWLEEWAGAPEDIIRTPGSESNVKEIYDRCAELDRDPENIIFNQFSEFGNYLAHYLCTGRAVERIIESQQRVAPELELKAFVAATGSAGTLAAGDYLKDRFGCRIVAVEALECPTMLYNGFGEHNIQGIGDKHIPLIHNVMNTDLVAAVSERATDALNVLFNSEIGGGYLINRRRVPRPIVRQLRRLGLSSICNILAAIKMARYFDFDESDVVLTIATDGAEMYDTEFAKAMERDFAAGFDEAEAAETFGQYVLGAATDHLAELSWRDRERIFNLGYFTWVEQQGLDLASFTSRKAQSFWRRLLDLVPMWDERIEEFNRRSGQSDGAR